MLLSQRLCLGIPLFASLAQSKQDESQETLTKSWVLSFSYNPRNVVHTCKMSNYISGNQAGLLLNKSSDFPFSPKGCMWHQAFLLNCGREPVCAYVCMHSFLCNLQGPTIWCEMFFVVYFFPSGLYFSGTWSSLLETTFCVARLYLK